MKIFNVKLNTNIWQLFIKHRDSQISSQVIKRKKKKKKHLKQNIFH